MVKEKDTEIQWIKFGEVESIWFISKDVIAFSYGNYIIFHDTLRPDKKDVIYRATNDVKGDGICCICTHRTLPCFALAEKCRNPRILINSYPNFQNMKTIEAFHETGYISMGFLEMEYLVTLTEFPNYSIIVWNWRTKEKLCMRDGSIRVPKQILRVSLTTPLQIAQADPKQGALIIWELNKCYRKAVLNDFRIKIPGEAKPPFSHVWGTDGFFYLSDSCGNLFSVNAETHICEMILIDKEEGDEDCIPCLSWFRGGLAYSVPGGMVQFCKRKSPEGWQKVWSLAPPFQFKLLFSSLGKDMLYGLNETHELVQFRGENNVEMQTLKSYGSDFDFICLIRPVCDYFVTFSNTRRMFTIWHRQSGVEVSKMKWDKFGKVNDVKPNPVYPYLLVMVSTGRVFAINLYDPLFPFVLHEVFLLRESIDTARFHVSGTRICVANMETGKFFLLKMFAEPKMEISANIKLELKIVNYALIGETTAPKLVILPMSQLCCRSGHTLLIYTVNQQKKIFYRTEDITLPTIFTSIIPKNNTQLYGVPHRSRYIYTISVANGAIVEKMVSGHQMKSFSIKPAGDFFVTYGYDGIGIVRSCKGMECVTVVTPNHRLNKGIKNVIVDPYCENIITLGVDGTMVSFTYNGPWHRGDIRNELEDMMKSVAFKQTLLFPLVAAKARTKAMEKIMAHPDANKFREEQAETEEEQAASQKTWVETRELEKRELDEVHWQKERVNIEEELALIRDELQNILNENLLLPKEVQLPIQEFDLDKTTRRKMMEDAKAEREKEKYMQIATAKAKDKVSEYVKTLCWDSIEVKGRQLHGIVSPLTVESYSLTQTDEEEKEEMYWISQKLRMEQYYRRGDYFEPWIPRSPSALDLQMKEKVQLSEMALTQTLKTKFEEDELDEQGHEAEMQDKLSRLLWSGTTTHNFIEISDDHYSQLEITGSSHTLAEIPLILSEVRLLMSWFNKEFNEVSLMKEREVAAICERHNRFRHIINELNYFHFSPELCKTVIVDPEWVVYEQPERIVTVQDNELTSTPYLTPSEQEVIDRQTAEAERLRQLLLADDFKEKALIAMMDGVLEKLWENELKKEIVKPKCMLEKEPENYTEEDLKVIKGYEEAVRFLQSERERYRKILEADWIKIQGNVKDIVNRFDDRLSKLHLLKMKVESAICQEILKVLRMRLKMQVKLETTRKEENIREEMARNEKYMDNLQQDMTKFQEIVTECKAYYETLQNRDKNLDKNFKKEFPDVSPIICDQLYKISKKRPKALYKLNLYSTLLLDLGKCTVSCSKPDYLTPECIHYLKEVDNLDNISNAPPSISEQHWEMLCKMRRAKIECELKVRACGVDLNEAESTVLAYQKKLKAAKELQIQYQNDLQNIKHERMIQDQDYDIQLVLKSGLVEIPLSGKISDFEESVLVTRDVLLHINGIITRAGNQKIKSMKKAANFRKGIIFKEWEHKKLRMEIEDLQNKLKTVEKIEVTKELQAILAARKRGFPEEKGFLYMEEELAATREKFRKTHEDLKQKIEEYNVKIDKLSSENDELDSRIAELNVDVNELSMDVDKNFDEKQMAKNMKRLKKVRYRNKLMQKIHKQHNEIIMLQTELELLRLRTFPTLKVKS